MSVGTLKRLKESLKSHGLVGQTNKGKKRTANDARIQREEAVKSVRDSFNIFDAKTSKDKMNLGKKQTVSHSSVTKSSDEKKRQDLRRAEVSRKNKVGGLLDRRFGENDSDLTQEEKMLARFTRERQQMSQISKASKGSLFNLDDYEDNYGSEEGLTHLGQSLGHDDFQEDDLGVSDEESEEGRVAKKPKRLAAGNENHDEASEGHIKSKKERFEEIIAKSKMHKAERQQLKEQDQDIIEDLDEGLEDLLGELRGTNSFGNAPFVAPDDKDAAYEKRMKEMVFDRRAQPSDRTKTEEEINVEYEERMKKLERERQERMEGIDNREAQGDDLGDDFASDDEFGFHAHEESIVEGEEGSNQEVSELEDSESETAMDANTRVRKVLVSSPELKMPGNEQELFEATNGGENIVNYTQRLLKQYHPSKAPENSEKNAQFAVTLAEYICKHPDQNLDELILIFKKLTEKYVETVSSWFREQFQVIGEKLTVSNDGANGCKLAGADYLKWLLVGIIYSTSDHYHVVATTASLIACQRLSQIPLSDESDVKGGLFLCNVLSRYQRLSKRYIPEVISFLANSLNFLLRPKGCRQNFDSIYFSNHQSSKKTLQLKDVQLQPLSLTEIQSSEQLFLHTIDTISKYATLWTDLAAFSEIFSPFSKVLYPEHPLVDNFVKKINNMTRLSLVQRQPLTMQSHRPLPIRSLVPKFEENYNPDKKSYDPDRQRQEISKLRSQIKKEKKGAMRDMRKDTAFISREKVREKRDADKAYHERIARLERTIATEEGNEANKYEREKAKRKRKN